MLSGFPFELKGLRDFDPPTVSGVGDVANYMVSGCLS